MGETEMSHVKPFWTDLREDITAYVDEQGEILAKIVCKFDGSWNYKDKDFFTKDAAKNYVEKVKRYESLNEQVPTFKERKGTLPVSRKKVQAEDGSGNGGFSVDEYFGNKSDKE